MASIKKNFVFNALLSVSRVIFPLISFPYSSRILGPESIGAVNFVDSYTQYFCILAALGIPIYGVRQVAKLRDNPIDLQKLTSELIVINFISTLGWCVAYYLIAWWTGKLSELPGLHILGSIYLLLYTFPVEWFFQGTENFGYITVRSLLLNVLSLGLLFILVKTEQDVLWYYGITIVVFAMNGGINLIKLTRSVKLTLKNLEYKKHFRPLFFLFSSQIAINVYVLLDKVILGYLAENKYVGYYSTASKLTKILLTFIGALAIVMVPQMAKAFDSNDMTKARGLFKNSCEFVITISIPIVFGLFCLSDDLVGLISGAQFAPAANSMRILAPIILLIGLNNIFGMQVLIPKGRERLLFMSVTVGMFVSVALNFALIPFFMHNGAALATLATEFAVALVTGYYALKELNERMDWLLIVKTILVCIPFYFIYKLMPAVPGWVRIISTAVIAGVYYTAVQIWILKNRLWKDQYSKIINLVKK
ncbi:flippase [Chitinophaga ginsengisegetis]|uniref:flippase n=1 Tax=Chitinophaga ginsengisegetis TaxID=393003 RepID=UPI000DB913C7|nr:flippase [Chitinophaga ginsengisegetis]MDR6566550.1 O-antigen/teichoic acid export membrane protein [Chitinophaga ginsengisegetis]MDR6646280.1 O-antigen/teichoic acid export membrane protein [Chitinophaga ginsengisegetis]MDR6651127.1 O-antigen/teichoic acid export membrane protein [Chitinophaga ginsengisegetis]